MTTSNQERQQQPAIGTRPSRFNPANWTCGALYFSVDGQVIAIFLTFLDPRPLKNQTDIYITYIYIYTHTYGYTDLSNSGLKGTFDSWTGSSCLKNFYAASVGQTCVAYHELDTVESHATTGWCSLLPMTAVLQWFCSHNNGLLKACFTSLLVGLELATRMCFSSDIRPCCVFMDVGEPHQIVLTKGNYDPQLGAWKRRTLAAYPMKHLSLDWHSMGTHMRFIDTWFF